MIPGYTEHSANERTFLAWVRTGIAIIAFGFVVEKFKLFVLALANTNSAAAGHRLQLAMSSGPLGHYDGLALILVGLAVVVIAAARFVHTSRMIDDKEVHFAGGIRAEVILSAVLAVIVTGLFAYLLLS